MEQVKDKVIVITGASSGIGAASAKLLAKNGAKVALGARNEANLKKITDEINNNGGKAIYSVTDVTNPKQVENLVQKALDTFKHLDAIFNNAGIMPLSPMSKLDTKDWTQTIDINLKGVLNGIAAVLPIFTKQKHGQIVTTSSIAGKVSFLGAGVYGATKFAVKDLMEVTRQESVKEGTNIRTTTLYPGAINTNLINSVNDKNTKGNLDKMYAAFGIQPDAVAESLLFALSQPKEVDITDITIYPTKQA